MNHMWETWLSASPVLSLRGFSGTSWTFKIRLYRKHALTCSVGNAMPCVLTFEISQWVHFCFVSQVLKFEKKRCQWWDDCEDEHSRGDVILKRVRLAGLPCFFFFFFRLPTSPVFFFLCAIRNAAWWSDKKHFLATVFSVVKRGQLLWRGLDPLRARSGTSKDGRRRRLRPGPVAAV